MRGSEWFTLISSRFQMELTYFLSNASKHPLTHFITWQAPGQSPLSLNIFKFKSENQYNDILIKDDCVFCKNWYLQASLISRINNVDRNQKYRVRYRVVNYFGAKNIACFNQVVVRDQIQVRWYLPDICLRMLAQGRFLSGRWCSTWLWPEVSLQKQPIVTLLFAQSGTCSATEKGKGFFSADDVKFYCSVQRCLSVKFSSTKFVLTYFLLTYWIVWFVTVQNDLFLLTFPVSCWALLITIVDILKVASENESEKSEIREFGECSL